VVSLRYEIWVTKVPFVPAHPDSPPLIDTDDLVLRSYRDSDVPDLLRAFEDDQIQTWNPGPHTEAEVLEWMRGRNDWSDRGHASWAISDPAGRLLGSVSFHKIEWEQRDCEVGYWLAPWGRGSGVAARSLRLALTYVFGPMEMHRVYLFHAVENPASCGVARGAGFRLEGELKQSYKYPIGYRDEHLHAVLADEFTG
jgi:RimJ/RimL family protein N-acetyltransferase